MDINIISTVGGAISSPKRLFILRKFIEKNDLTWSEIVSMMEDEYQIRLNPNTVSFHLKYLMDRGIISKAGNHYVLDSKMETTIKKMVS